MYSTKNSVSFAPPTPVYQGIQDLRPFKKDLRIFKLKIRWLWLFLNPNLFSQMKTLTLHLPEEVEVEQAKMLIAATLYQQGLLSSGQAAEMAGITRRQFLEEVGTYGVSIFGESPEDIQKISTLD